VSLFYRIENLNFNPNIFLKTTKSRIKIDEAKKNKKLNKIIWLYFQNNF
jgi:hypothetical protein